MLAGRSDTHALRSDKVLLHHLPSCDTRDQVRGRRLPTVSPNSCGLSPEKAFATAAASTVSSSMLRRHCLAILPLFVFYSLLQPVSDSFFFF